MSTLSEELRAVTDPYNGQQVEPTSWIGLLVRAADELDRMQDAIDHHSVPKSIYTVTAADLAELEAQKAAVLAIHRKANPTAAHTYCVEDGHLFPCPTAVALGVEP